MGGARTGTTGTFQRKCLDFLIFQQTPNTLYIRYCKWRQRSETLTIGWISICGILDCFPTLVFYYSPITLRHIFTQHAFVFTIFWLRSTNHSYRFYELNTPLMEEYSINLLHGAHAFAPFAERRRSMHMQLGHVPAHRHVFPSTGRAGSWYGTYSVCITASGMHACKNALPVVNCMVKMLDAHEYTI